MANHRRNQQDGEYRPKIWGGVNGDISSEWEEHTVRHWPDGDFYGIILNEAPIRGDGIPSIIIARRVGMVDTPLSEVDLEIDPSTGEFSVDYEEAGFDGTGRIFASPAEEGATWIVKRYAGVGETDKDSENLEVEGDFTVGGVVEDIDGQAVGGYGTRNGDTVPFYVEEIAFTLAPGTNTVPHGISGTPYDDNLLFCPSVRDVDGVANPGVSSIDYDNTNFIIESSVAASVSAFLTFCRWRE